MSQTILVSLLPIVFLFGNCHTSEQECYYPNAVYNLPGDVVFMGIFNLHSGENCSEENKHEFDTVQNTIQSIKRLNTLGNVLPNIEIGVNIYDACSVTSKAEKAIVNALFDIECSHSYSLGILTTPTVSKSINNIVNNLHLPQVVLSNDYTINIDLLFNASFSFIQSVRMTTIHMAILPTMNYVDMFANLATVYRICLNNPMTYNHVQDSKERILPNFSEDSITMFVGSLDEYQKYSEYITAMSKNILFIPTHISPKLLKEHLEVLNNGTYILSPYIHETFNDDLNGETIVDKEEHPFLQKLNKKYEFNINLKFVQNSLRIYNKIKEFKVKFNQECNGKLIRNCTDLKPLKGDSKNHEADVKNINEFINSFRVDNVETTINGINIYRVNQFGDGHKTIVANRILPIEEQGEDSQLDETIKKEKDNTPHDDRHKLLLDINNTNFENIEKRDLILNSIHIVTSEVYDMDQLTNDESNDDLKFIMPSNDPQDEQDDDPLVTSIVNETKDISSIITEPIEIKNINIADKEINQTESENHAFKLAEIQDDLKIIDMTINETLNTPDKIVKKENAINANMTIEEIEENKNVTEFVDYSKVNKENKTSDKTIVVGSIISTDKISIIEPAESKGLKDSLEPKTLVEEQNKEFRKARKVNENEERKIHSTNNGNVKIEQDGKETDIIDTITKMVTEKSIKDIKEPKRHRRSVNEKDETRLESIAKYNYINNTWIILIEDEHMKEGNEEYLCRILDEGNNNNASEEESIGKNCNECYNFREIYEIIQLNKQEIENNKKKFIDIIFKIEFNNDSIVVCILSLTVIGIIGSVIILSFILYRIFKKDVLEGNPTITILLLVSIIYNYFIIIPFVVNIQDGVEYFEYYSNLLCYIRLICIITSFNFIFSLLLTRCLMLSFCDHDGALMSHINGYIQSSFCFFITIIQILFLINLFLIKYVFNINIQCNVIENNYLFMLSYNIILLFLLLLTLPFIYKCKRNYFEGIYLTITILAIAASWIVWIILYIESNYSNTLLIVGIYVTSTIILLVIFIPRTYHMMINIVRDNITSILPALSSQYNTTGSIHNLHYRSTQALYDIVNDPDKQQLGEINPYYLNSNKKTEPKLKSTANVYNVNQNSNQNQNQNQVENSFYSGNNQQQPLDDFDEDDDEDLGSIYNESSQAPRNNSSLGINPVRPSSRINQRAVSPTFKCRVKSPSIKSRASSPPQFDNLYDSREQRYDTPSTMTRF